MKTQEENMKELMDDYGLDEFEAELMTTPLKLMAPEELGAAFKAMDKYRAAVVRENEQWVKDNPNSPLSRIAKGNNLLELPNG